MLVLNKLQKGEKYMKRILKVVTITAGVVGAIVVGVFITLCWILKLEDEKKLYRDCFDDYS